MDIRVFTEPQQGGEGEYFSFDGDHYQLRDCPALPRPVQSPPPVIVGGVGAHRTPELVARFAQEYNIPFPPIDFVPEAYANVDRACEEAGRDPATVVRSVALVACIGEDDAEISRRAAAIGREVDELRANGVAGTPAEALDRLDAFAAVGVERVYLQVLDLADLDHLHLVGNDVLPALR